MPPELTSETWTQVRYEYEHTDKPVEAICFDHGVSPGTLRDRMRRWHWARRRQPIPAEGPPSAPLSETTADAPAPHGARREETPADPAEIVPRLQGAVARVLPAIEATVAQLAAGPMQPREMERAARTLTSLTRTLRELNGLLSQYPPAEDVGPKNLDEFRAKLARKIDALIAQRPGNRPPEGYLPYGA